MATGNNARCLLCCGAAHEVSLRNEGLIIRRCLNCGLLVGNQKSVSATGPTGAVETDPNHFEMLVKDGEELRDILSSMIDMRMPVFEGIIGEKPKNWLEVGPGYGLLSDIVKEMGGYWRGVEIDADMAEKMVGAGRDVVQADFAQADLGAIIPDHVDKGGGFDIVFLSQVFEHVTAPKEFLQNVFKCLRPGGMVYIDVPNNDGFTAKLRTFNPRSSGFGEIVPPHHMIAYGKDTLRFALEQAGFVEAATFSKEYNHPVFGLAHARHWDNPKLNFIWGLSKILDMGGNLIGLAKRPLV